jgi:hypothetical protein
MLDCGQTYITNEEHDKLTAGMSPSMPNVDKKSTGGISYTLGCGFDGDRAMHYIATRLKVGDNVIKIASVCMLGEESQRHIRDACLKGKGRQKERRKDKI